MRVLIIILISIFGVFDLYSQNYLKLFKFSNEGFIIDSKELSNNEILLNISVSKNSSNGFPTNSLFYKIDSNGNLLEKYTQNDRLYFRIDTFQSLILAVGYDILIRNKLIITFFDQQLNIKKEISYLLKDDSLIFRNLYSTIYGNTLLISGFRNYLDNKPDEFPFLLKLNLTSGEVVEADKYPILGTLFMDSKIIDDSIYVLDYATLEKFDKDLIFANKSIELELNDSIYYAGPGNLFNVNNNLYIVSRKNNSKNGTRKISISSFSFEKNKIVKDITINVSEKNHYSGIFKGVSFKDPNKIFWTGWNNLGYFPNGDYPNDSSHIILALVDSNLNIKWQKLYGGDAYFTVYGLEELDNGDCIVYGSRYQPGIDTKRQGFLLRVNGDGAITTVYNSTPKEIVILNQYPNPAFSELIWQIPSDIFKGKLEINLFNNLGQLVLSRIINHSSDSLKIDISHLQSGIYFWKIKDNKKEANGSVFIIK